MPGTAGLGPLREGKAPAWPGSWGGFQEAAWGGGGEGQSSPGPSVSEPRDLATCRPALLTRGAAVQVMPLLRGRPGAAGSGFSVSPRAPGDQELQWVRRSAPGGGAGLQWGPLHPGWSSRLSLLLPHVGGVSQKRVGGKWKKALCQGTVTQNDPNLLSSSETKYWALYFHFTIDSKGLLPADFDAACL